MRPQIVDATPDMLRALGEAPRRGGRAIAVVRGDEVLGVAGVYLDETRWVAFCRIRDDIRPQLMRYRRELLLAARRLLEIAGRRRLKVCALADPAIDGSDRLLSHLGFTHAYGGIWVWPTPRQS